MPARCIPTDKNSQLDPGSVTEQAIFESITLQISDESEKSMAVPCLHVQASIPYMCKVPRSDPKVPSPVSAAPPIGVASGSRVYKCVP